MIAALPPAIEIPEGTRDMPVYTVHCRAIYPDKSDKEFDLTATGTHVDRRISLPAGVVKADQAAFQNAKPDKQYWAYSGFGAKSLAKPIIEDFVFGNDENSFTISLTLEMPKTSYLSIHAYEQKSGGLRWLLTGMCWPKAKVN
jgi:hypothetical protein